LPQISSDASLQQANYGNYWIEAVAKSSKNIDYAWNFILFAADASHVTSYLDEANKPAALRSLITTQINDEDVGVFAEQLLTAKSWYRGTDVDAAEEALGDLIDAILADPEEPEDAVDRAASIIRQTY